MVCPIFFKSNIQEICKYTFIIKYNISSAEHIVDEKKLILLKRHCVIPRENTESQNCSLKHC